MRRRKPSRKVVIRGIQFSYFYFLFLAAGAAVVLRITARAKEPYPDLGELCVLRLVEPVVHAADVDLDDDRLWLRQNDHR